MIRKYLSRSIVSSLVLLCVAGCGKDDSGRMPLSGTVTFRGQPVPAGVVSFTPDARRGNRGAQGMARIVDGKFSTQDQGKGGVAGPQIVEIRGFGHGPTTGDVLPGTPGERLFPPYTTEVDVSADGATFDFEVPDELGVKTSP